MIVACGASGNIGRPLVATLVAGGHDVRVVARDQGRARDLLPAPVAGPSVSPADATGLFLLGGDALPDADWLAEARHVRRAVLVTSLVGRMHRGAGPRARPRGDRPAAGQPVAGDRRGGHRGHAGREYPLTGPAELTVRHKIDALAGALGRHLSYVVRPDDPPAGDEVLAAVRKAGVSGLDSPGVVDTVESITGRPARSFAAWARENAAAFR